MNIITYSGFLSKGSYGEADKILFLSSFSDPIAEQLQSDICGKQVTVRYWITEKQATKEEAKDDFVRHLAGAADCEFGSRYSESTGYLWTDEKCKIGGHNILAELYSYVGKWLILEIEIHAST